MKKKQYLTVINKEQKEEANSFCKANTANTHDLFYAGRTTNGEDITHYISHHPFTEEDRVKMENQFEHFYDMDKITKEEVFNNLGLEKLPPEDEEEML